MKRLLSLSLALVMCLSLAACGGGQSASGSAGADTFSADLAQFYEDNVNKAGEFPMMMELDADMLEMTYPGLSDVERTQTVAYTAAISAAACEVAMVEVADAGDVKTVQDIFQARIDAQIDGGAWYPETIEQWQENAQIVTRGNYVCLFVVPEEFGDFAGAFNAL